MFAFNDLEGVVDFMGKAGSHFTQFGQPAGTDELLAQLRFLRIDLPHPAHDAVGEVERHHDNQDAPQQADPKQAAQTPAATPQQADQGGHVNGGAKRRIGIGFGLPHEQDPRSALEGRRRIEKIFF